MKKQEVIITIGLPASGKSTWAKKLIDDNPGVYKRVNKDDLRAMIDNKHWNSANEKFIINTRNDLIYNILQKGCSVIVDDTNLHPSHIEDIKSLVKRFNVQQEKDVEVRTQFFNTPIEECLKRDASRLNAVGDKVIYTMYNQYKHLYPFDTPDLIEQDTSLQKAVIVDVDGTIAQMNGRGPFEWHKVGEDLPKRDIIDIVEILNREGYYIIFLSGRDGCCRKETYSWIETYLDLMPGTWLLVMRVEDDNRSDDIIKKELFFEYVFKSYYIKWVLDDRNRLVSMWRSLGLTCLQVAPGNF